MCDTQYQSCRPIVQLCHNYDDVTPIDLSNAPCDTAAEAVALSIFSLCEQNGSTEDDIIALALQLCPDFTEAQLEGALRRGLNSGLFRTLRPSWICYTEPQQPTRFSFSEMMDRSSANQSVVRYVVGLAGGPCGEFFGMFFKKYRDPQDRTFRLYKRDILL